MRTLVIVAVVAALFLGCQQSRPANPLAPPMGPAVRTLKEEGDQLARSHDWAGAATKDQTALNRESSSLELRLAFGITLSHLDRREETIEQFRWVVNHSQPGTPEFVMARTWLVEAGEVDGGLRTASASPVTDAASASKETTPKGGVRGMTSWPGVAPRERLHTAPLPFSGVDPPKPRLPPGRRLLHGRARRLLGRAPPATRLRGAPPAKNAERRGHDGRG